MRRNCFNKRAQALTELATFGSVLLLALSFFVRYGMSYNYQQDAQMEAFRRGLSMAYNGTHSEISPSTQVVLAKDVHIPEPQDRFGIGDRVTVSGSANVIWTNELYNGTEYEVSSLPTIRYIINPQQSGEHNVNYEIAGWKEYDWADAGGSIKVRALGQEYNITKSETRVTNEKKMKVLLIPTGYTIADCISGSVFCPTDIVSSADVDSDGRKQEEIIIEATGPVDDEVTGFKVVDYQNGTIDADYLQLNNYIDNDGTPDVNAQNLQGLLPDKEVTIWRDGSLTLREDSGASGKYLSDTLISNSGERVIHKIRTNTGTEPETFSSSFPRYSNESWETVK